MRIAVPVSDGILDPHFGHCRQFALYDVDPVSGDVLGRSVVDAPPHEPGLLPSWLAGQGAGVVLAGGMGRKAVQLFAENEVEVVVGVPVGDPEDMVRRYLTDDLGGGTNACDH
jgi:predicted Fe-Mo cluster-binding NifX family protein